MKRGVGILYQKSSRKCLGSEPGKIRWDIEKGAQNCKKLDRYLTSEVRAKLGTQEKKNCQARTKQPAVVTLLGMAHRTDRKIGFFRKTNRVVFANLVG